MSYYGKSKTKVFISFDYDNDSDLKTLLVGQPNMKTSHLTLPIIL